MMGVLDLKGFSGPFQPNPFYDSMIQHKCFAQICSLKSITCQLRKVELFLVLVSPAPFGYFLLSTALALAPLCPAQAPQHSMSQRHAHYPSALGKSWDLQPKPSSSRTTSCVPGSVLGYAHFPHAICAGVIQMFNHSLEVLILNLWGVAGQEQPPPLHRSMVPLMSCHASNLSVSLQPAPLAQPDDDDAPPPLPQRTPESFIVAGESGE